MLVGTELTAMANNRLWIVDTRTNERFLVAKSFGSGWVPWDMVGLREWLSDFDRDPASYGGGTEPSTLRLVNENEQLGLSPPARPWWRRLFPG